jgi:hypothetical protein
MNVKNYKINISFSDTTTLGYSFRIVTARVSNLLIFSISDFSMPKYESQTYFIFFAPIVFGKNVIE